MSSPRQKVRWGLVIIIGVAIALYILFQAKNILLGPELAVKSPLDGATLTTNLVDISGAAKNTASITLDDRPIFVDTNGAFDEKLIAPVGYSIIQIEAKDRFGQSTIKRIHVYLPESAVPLVVPTATSSPATSTASSTLENQGTQ